MGTGRQYPQPGADPAPALPVASSNGWLPLTPSGVAAFARSPLKRILVLQVISATVCTLVIAWLLVSSVFPTIQQALHHLPDQGSISLGELLIPEDATLSHPLAASTWLALDVDPTAGANRNASRDLDIVFARDGVRIISSLGTARIPYPILWRTPFNRVEMVAAWEAWQGMLYGGILLACFMALTLSWWLLATLHCPLPRILAYFTDRELTLSGAWKQSAAALIPGALLMTLGLVLLEIDLIGGIQFALLFVIHFLVPVVYSMLATCHLPPRTLMAEKAKNPFGNPPTGVPPGSPASSRPPAAPAAPRKPANPFARID